MKTALFVVLLLLVVGPVQASIEYKVTRLEWRLDDHLAMDRARNKQARADRLQLRSDMDFLVSRLVLLTLKPDAFSQKEKDQLLKQALKVVKERRALPPAPSTL